MLSTYNHYTQMMSSSFDNNVDRMLKKARTIEDKTEKKRKSLGRTAERHKLINESRFETFKVTVCCRFCVEPTVAGKRAY